ncbi:MAG: hypothetical protein NT046_09980 [Arenimonas sp.]|nr:hypothetical protein [Arenimonas sp.]
MTLRFRLASAACFGLASLALAAAEPPRITGTDGEDDRLAIEFDRPMLTWRGESDTAGITLSPQVECRWFWEQDTTLACQVPEGSTRPFRQATSYRLELPGGLWSQAGAELAPTTLDVVSSRPEPRVQISDWNAGQPALRVVSHEMPLTLQDLAQVLELRLDDQPVDYTLAPLSAKQLASMYLSDGGSAFNVLPTRWPTTRGTLVVSVREGLRSPAGPVRGEARRLLTTRVNEPLRLVGLGCGWSRMPMTAEQVEKWGRDECAPDADVALVFSRRLAKGEAERIAAGLPGLAVSKDSNHCRWDCGDNEARFHVGFTATAAGVSLPIVLPADLRADDGSLIEAGAVPVLVFRDHPASVRSEPPVRLLRPGGDAALALEVRNLDAPATVAELGTGRRTRLRESALPVTGITNRFEPWRAKAPRGDVARSGGLTLAGVRGSPAPGLAVAVAPFNVIAAADAGRVMVWATDWDTAAAIADASIDLLRVTAEGREPVRARGRTGADGVGYVPAPKEEIQDERTQTRLVRVRHDGRCCTGRARRCTSASGRASATAIACVRSRARRATTRRWCCVHRASARRWTPGRHRATAGAAWRANAPCRQASRTAPTASPAPTTATAATAPAAPASRWRASTARRSGPAAPSTASWCGPAASSRSTSRVASIPAAVPPGRRSRPGRSWRPRRWDQSIRRSHGSLSPVR